MESERDTMTVDDRGRGHDVIGGRELASYVNTMRNTQDVDCLGYLTEIVVLVSRLLVAPERSLYSVSTPCTRRG